MGCALFIPKFYQEQFEPYIEEIPSEQNKLLSLAMEELNCSVCREQFDEINHIPRTLSCGHTCCDPCLASVLSGCREQRLCPECRQVLQNTQVSHYPISYTLLRIVRVLTGREALQISDQTRGQGPKPIPGTCSTHGTPLCYRCVKCNVGLCYTCHSTHKIGAACAIIAAHTESQVDKFYRNSNDAFLPNADEIKKTTVTVRNKFSRKTQTLLTENHNLKEKVQQANNNDWTTALERYEAQVVKATAGKRDERSVEESCKHHLEFDSWKNENFQTDHHNGNNIQLESGVPIPYEILYDAEYSVNIDSVEGAIKSGNFQSLDKNGMTPLYWATSNGKVELVRRLLKAGADVHSANWRGVTPLRCAREKGTKSWSSWIENAASGSTYKNNSGVHDLSDDQKKEYVKIAKLLKKYGGIE